MKQQYPEVENSIRILMTGGRLLMELGEKQSYEENALLTESSFFDFFDLKFAHGDPKTALDGTNSVVISQELAEKYFGKENPVGKTLTVNKNTMLIKGVLAKVPEHFHLKVNYFMPIVSAGIPKERMESWNWQQFYTYLKLKPGTNAKALEAKFQQ